MHFEDPSPGPGEAVIRMKASGMCGSDLHHYRSENPILYMASTGLVRLGERGIETDTRIIAGHEPCGVIEALGAGVDRTHFKPGDRVIVYHYEGCGVCDHCRTGWTQMCDDGTKPHGAVLNGGHADFMRAPVSTLVKMPDEISFAAGAAIACGTGTAYGACMRLGLSARDTLAVFGLGPVGLSAVQLAAAMGVEVFGVDIDPQRVAAAKRFGAAHAINGREKDPVEEVRKLTRGKGASCAMDCAGGTVPKQQAVRATASWGRIAMVAVNGVLELGIWADMIAKQRTILGSWTFSITGMRECAWFIADHGVAVDDIFSDRWSLDQAETAYREFDKQAGGKGVFLFD